MQTRKSPSYSQYLRIPTSPPVDLTTQLYLGYKFLWHSISSASTPSRHLANVYSIGLPRDRIPPRTQESSPWRLSPTWSPLGTRPRRVFLAA